MIYLRMNWKYGSLEEDVKIMKIFCVLRLKYKTKKAQRKTKSRTRFSFC